MDQMDKWHGEMSANHCTKKCKSCANKSAAGQLICLNIYRDVPWVCVETSRFGKYTHLSPAKPDWVSMKVHFWKFLSSGSLQEVLISVFTQHSLTPDENSIPLKKPIGVLFWIYMGPSFHANVQNQPCCIPSPCHKLLHLLCRKCWKSHKQLPIAEQSIPTAVGHRRHAATLLPPSQFPAAQPSA